MKTIDLCGDWELVQVGGEIGIGARVPGQVHLDLLRAGEIEDPYWRDNETRYLWIGHSTWEYRRTFAVGPDILAEREVRLVCEGIDTVSTIEVNGTELGRTENMFRRYVFDLKPFLREGENRIAVRIRPPMEYAAERAAAYPYSVPYAKNSKEDDHHNFVRKSGTHFGWDWGPYMFPCGIWRPIRVEAFSEAVVTYVAPVQRHRPDGDVELELTVFLDSPGDASGSVEVSVAGARASRGVELSRGENRARLSLLARRPSLWWPAGCGESRLYGLDASFVGSGGERHGLARRIGFRTVELVREPDERGESFFFRVNGLPLYAKGANWIPADSFDARNTRERLSRLLTSARDANMNMLRVWGGGVYESDAFYDLCDELGLLVWQEFMFACALYPADDSFLANVEAEARHQLRRLAHHPCIALWSGNNECEQALSWFAESRANRDRYVVDYSKLYVDTLGRVVREEDPSRPYWPSSPSNGIQAWGDPNDQTRGDTHYWDVWHGGKPFSEYLKVCPRFSSEFGFQSFPSLETLRQALAELDLNVTSPLMEYRQRSGTGNVRIIEHISRWFRMPDTFESFVYLSQVLQALSIKTAVEHWRRLRPHCMGALYWQLNDIWQGPSWSSLEYDGRWKMLHYFAARFFAPVLVSAVETERRLAFWVTNDLARPVTGRLELALWSWSGRRLAEWSEAFSLPPLASAVAKELAVGEILSENRPEECFLVLEASWPQGRAENFHLLAPPKAAELAEPGIRAEVLEGSRGGIPVRLECSAPAPFVFLSAGPLGGRWSDNGLLLLPGRPVEVLFHAWEDVGSDALRRSLEVASLRDSYAPPPAR